MATETEAQKKLREEAEKAEKLAEEQRKNLAAADAAKVTFPPAVPFVPAATTAPVATTVPATAPAAAAKSETEREAARDSSTSGETSSPNPSEDGKAPSLLDQVLADQKPAETFVPTYTQNRWKVGVGHSMLGRWVEGEEIDVSDLSNLGTNDTDKRRSLERLLRVGAIVRMGDHEPRGGIASGHLAPLGSTIGATNPRDGTDQILMGPDMRERIDGQATAQEVRDRTRR